MKCCICNSETSISPCAQCRDSIIYSPDRFNRRIQSERTLLARTACKLIGNENGYSKISNAAWTIAAGRKEDAEYLYGKKAGSLESLILLQEVAANAERIVDLLNVIRIAYNAGDLERIRVVVAKELEKRNDPADDPVDVCNKRRQQNKKYLKRILFLLLGFFLGLLMRLIF